MEVFKRKKPEILKVFDEAIGNITPIPLTAKILEKNGFHLLIDNCRIDTYGRYGIYISMFSIPKITIIQQETLLIQDLQIQYVHQLQHILHIYGMDDLANSFKI